VQRLGGAVCGVLSRLLLISDVRAMMGSRARCCAASSAAASRRCQWQQRQRTHEYSQRAAQEQAIKHEDVAAARFPVIYLLKLRLINVGRGMRCHLQRATRQCTGKGSGRRGRGERGKAAGGGGELSAWHRDGSRRGRHGGATDARPAHTRIMSSVHYRHSLGILHRCSGRVVSPRDGRHRALPSRTPTATALCP
jgi:hypothetical protein